MCKVLALRRGSRARIHTWRSWDAIWEATRSLGRSSGVSGPLSADGTTNGATPSPLRCERVAGGVSLLGADMRGIGEATGGASPCDTESEGLASDVRMGCSE